MNSIRSPIESHRPPGLVESFETAWLLDNDLTAEHWEYLWRRFGVQELVEIGRRSGWLDTDNPRDAVLELVRRSRAAGHDPLAPWRDHAASGRRADDDSLALAGPSGH